MGFYSIGEVNADIISFNYTKTIEGLLMGKIDGEYNYSDRSTSDLFRVRSIKHIHGILNESDLLFGVNDPSQVANEDFCRDENFQDLIIKPKGNVELGTNVDTDCSSLIQNADIFYIYGTSLGPTDTYWWECIGSRFINSNAIILYFHFNPQKLKKRLLERDYIDLERSVRKQIMETMGIGGKESSYRHRIYIAYNSDIFPTYPKMNIFV